MITKERAIEAILQLNAQSADYVLTMFEENNIDDANMIDEVRCGAVQDLLAFVKQIRQLSESDE